MGNMLSTVPPLPSALSQDAVDALRERTPFDEREIVRLHSKYCALDENGDSMLSVDELKCLDELRANPFSHRICFLFSQDGRSDADGSEAVGAWQRHSELRRLCGYDGGILLPHARRGEAHLGVCHVGCEHALPALRAPALGTHRREAHVHSRESSHRAPTATDFDGDNIISASDIKVGLDLIVNYQDEFTRELGLRETHDKMSPQALDQVVAKVLTEMDPRGRGVKFNDFRQVLTRMPDFLFNFRMTI